MASSKYSILAYETFDEHQKCLSKALKNTSQISFQSDPKSFAKAVKNTEYDVIFMRVSPQNASAFDLLKKTRQQTPYTPIILTSKSEQTDLIVQAIKLGAYDFISTPFSPARIQLVVQRAVEQRKLTNEIDYLRRSQDIVYNFESIVAESESFRQIIASLKKFASTDSTILLTGKTGTGKSFLSGSVHFNSPRREHPFIKINCTNIPDTLLESELFGHEKGSFTGAEKQRIGRFEQANGGTIFLDEIGEIPLEIQAKLLRVLEERAFERVGGNTTIHVDVRIIAATNKNLAKQIRRGKFREDLYYRINVLPVELPTLQDRSQCIEPLAHKLLEKSSAALTKKIKGFSPNALAIIKSYTWPGNIRQLANTLERAVILEESNTIRSDSIQIPDFHQPVPKPGKHCEPLQTQEKELILRALEENLWVQKNAAKALGVSPRALNYKVNKFGITHPNWRKNK
ncbi:MAG: sigma-54-dependent Fis family transcriptional regulator [Desulfobulbus sp.]|nr:MAG: sigma-54-dependent Fis family transcriptional regulator [Desulfobulbus sp.]RUM38394.1 MAG: sigma-54-dependent Fis family transcriptional regulator [Desulfobulbus sp.]